MIRKNCILLFVILGIIMTGCSPKSGNKANTQQTSDVVENTASEDMKTFPRGEEITGFEDIEKACQLAAENKFEESIRLFDELIPKYKGKPVATAYILAQRGGAYDHFNEPEKAEKDFRDALKQDVSDDVKAVILFQLARNMDQAKNQYGGRTREDEIYEVLKEIERLKPDFEINSRVGQKAGITAIKMLAEIQLLRGEYQQAIDCIGKGLSKKPNDTDLDLLEDRAKAYYLSGNLTEARVYAEKRMSVFNSEKSGKSKKTLTDISPYIHLILGRNDEALQSAEKIISEEPKNPWLYLDRARVLRVLNRNKEADKDVEKALSLSGKDPLIRKQAETIK